MEMKKNSLVNIALSAVFTAIIMVCAQISLLIPNTGVSLTLQTFAVALCGFCLGAKYGTASVAVYLLLGACGAPVFSRFLGGFWMFFGRSGGFLTGFIPFVILTGIAKKQKKYIYKILISIAGLAVCHIIGVVQFAAVAGVNLKLAFFSVSLPFILKDIISIILAELISKRIKII